MKLKIFGITILFFFFLTAHCQKAVIFYSQNCPICKYYLPIIINIAKEKPEANFKIILPYAADKKEIKQNYTLAKNMTLITDKKQRIVRHYGATATPQAFVVCSDSVLYSGAIDDKYYAIGKYKQFTQIRYLLDALDFCDGKKQTLPIRETTPVGCVIAK